MSSAKAKHGTAWHCKERSDFVYPYNLTRQQTESFIRENLDAFLDILLTTCSYDVDSILMNHMQDDLEEYAKGCWEWEAC